MCAGHGSLSGIDGGTPANLWIQGQHKNGEIICLCDIISRARTRKLFLCGCY